jgi:hypothetical protein
MASNGEPLKKRAKTQVFKVFTAAQMRQTPYNTWNEFHNELEMYSKATNQVLISLKKIYRINH